MLIFSLSAIVSVELSLACNIQIGENERGRCLSDFSTIYALLFSIFQGCGEILLRSTLWSGASAFFTPERRVGAESLKAPESVSGVLRVFQDIIQYFHVKTLFFDKNVKLDTSAKMKIQHLFHYCKLNMLLYDCLFIPKSTFFF